MEEKSGNTEQRQALKHLNVFVGKWNTEGETKTLPVLKIKGTDTYEWLDGGYFLIHSVDVHTGEEAMKAIEIMGYDVSGNFYPTHSYDSQGNSGTYEARVTNGIWTFQGESERATLAISKDGNTMNAHWELLTNNKDWIPWMDIKLTKVTSQ